MKLTTHSLLELFNRASNFKYELHKHLLGYYQLNLTLGYQTTGTGESHPDIISIIIDSEGEVNVNRYFWFCNEMNWQLRKKAKKEEEERRKEFLASMSDEDKELLGLK